MTAPRLPTAPDPAGPATDFSGTPPMSDLSAMRKLLAELEQSDALDAEDVEDTYDDSDDEAPPSKE